MNKLFFDFKVINMDIYNLLTIVFQNQQLDLSFVFKFRKISKRCKVICEYWLRAIDDRQFLDNVRIVDFRNLLRLQCSERLLGKDIEKLTKLTHLKLGLNQNIVDSNIKSLTNLICLDISNFWGNIPKITNNAVKQLKLKVLNVNDNNSITDDAINLMTTLECLFANGNSGITDKGLLKLNLYIISANWNTKITNKGIEHMSNLKSIAALCNPFITVTCIERSLSANG